MMKKLGLFFILLLIVADHSVVRADDSVRLMVGRSAIVSVGSPIARVSLTTPDIADALVTSPTELLINGKTPGTISMFVWDRAGSIKRYEVIVQRDLARLTEQMQQLFPGEKIEVRSNGRDIVLAGTVRDKAVMDKAINLAAGFVDKKEEVINLLALQEGAPSNQVLLKVRFAEVSRSALTELGASFVGNGFKDGRWYGRTTTEQFPAPEWDKDGKLVFSDFLNFFLLDAKNDVGLLVRALQQRGLLQSLAEPNLVAESGKDASFLAGGEIPVPIAQPGSGGAVAITVVFKEFGIRLNFTPVVNGDRVHLKVRPEVSSLDFSNAVLLNGFKIPALSTRRTETELELQNGQTFAIAGLVSSQMNKTLAKVPGIGDIPILGLLFRSEAAQKDRTELVVMITPMILPNNSPGVTPNLPRLAEPFLPPIDPKKSIEPAAPAFAAPRTTTAAVQPSVPATAAAAVQALTPQTRTVVNGDALPARPITPAAAVSRPLTPQEQKTLERVHKQEAEAAKRQAEIDKAAHETQAKRDAEIAKKQAEIDKKKQKEMAEAEAKLKAAQAAYDAEVAKAKKKGQ
ncbi:MAG TPA: pilus assembly protein N-terminal domain-containing protein [Vicinamibacterales bacterium]|nr:pilus assembly protein N-terminal domain-containing protein [Vicinamibacterales bacterium]